jgi:hypothetical protein
MNPEHNLLNLLDPKKTTSPITSLPKLSSETCKAFSAKSKTPTCSTKSSNSPENVFNDLSLKEAPKPKEKVTIQSKPRSGDWICLICGNHNYSFRESCNRCQKQTKACNLQQSLRIYDNPALKNDLMKNETMAKRLEFNFCYSLSSGKMESKVTNTLNSNVISGGGYQVAMPFGLVNNCPQFPGMSEYYYPQKAQSYNMSNSLVNPLPQQNFMSGFSRNQMQEPQHHFAVHSDFPSKFNGYQHVSEISPMLNYNINQGFPNFKKGTIKSDICHDKSMTHVGLRSTPSQNMQQNLVEKFKQMNLIPGSQKLLKTKKALNEKKKLKKADHLRNKKKKKQSKASKENQKPGNGGNKKLKFKQKRRGKIKYKAVELTQNKKNILKKKPKMNSQKVSNKATQMMNATKSVEDLFESEFYLKKNLFNENEEEQEKKMVYEVEASPHKMNLGSIFHSKLLFDFETPKKSKNDCFLNDNSLGKDSDFKHDYGFSKHKNKILRLFTQSDDEESEDESGKGSYLDKIMDEDEFSQSIQKMKNTGFNPSERVF